ncbi:carbon-nitrogen hydrolase family protein [Clostridium drakei]|uniref:Carbon-nitrogen hydrolase family protein n=1 Tax=Clostridium drakei TaxID=332101 RepID=A0A2U8DLL0_9CLOT|nr:carbon-nitrogen hydrolase family protein [Clostridium drakei]AWI03586.1 carbon-nitrogen hydrolase family protein [Clostridium drakei]
MKISAVHMDTILADVNANMANAKIRIEEAVNAGTELVLFPEFFTTGFAFMPKLLDVVVKCENPQIKLSKWAKQYNVIIGGSYLQYNGKDVLNTFSLTFPNGEVFTHSKDIPTVFEHFCYTYGDKNNVLETPIGNIGVALCWEQIRYDTVKRMIGKVDLLLNGSCWWGFCEDDTRDLHDTTKETQTVALNAPIDLAKILHVPVVHASHFATFTGLNFPNADKPQTRMIMGATQIIDEDGNVIKRRLYNEAAGIITSDVKYNRLPKNAEHIETDSYWIPKMPTIFLKGWNVLNPICEKYYQNVSKPYCIKLYNKLMK